MSLDLQMKGKLAVDVLCQCISHSRAAEQLPEPRRRSAVEEGVSRFMVNGTLDLNGVWTTLLREPGVTERGLAAPFAVLEDYQNILQIPMAPVQRLMGLNAQQRQALMAECVVSRSEIERMVRHARIEAQLQSSKIDAKRSSAAVPQVAAPEPPPSRPPAEPHAGQALLIPPPPGAGPVSSPGIPKMSGPQPIASAPAEGQAVLALSVLIADTCIRLGPQGAEQTLRRLADFVRDNAQHFGGLGLPAPMAMPMVVSAPMGMSGPVAGPTPYGVQVTGPLPQVGLLPPQWALPPTLQPGMSDPGIAGYGGIAASGMNPLPVAPAPAPEPPMDEAQAKAARAKAARALLDQVKSQDEPEKPVEKPAQKTAAKPKGQPQRSAPKAARQGPSREDKLKLAAAAGMLVLALGIAGYAFLGGSGSSLDVSSVRALPLSHGVKNKETVRATLDDPSFAKLDEATQKEKLKKALDELKPKGVEALQLYDPTGASVGSAFPDPDRKGQIMVFISPKPIEAPVKPGNVNPGASPPAGGAAPPGMVGGVPGMPGGAPGAPGGTPAMPAIPQ